MQAPNIPRTKSHAPFSLLCCTKVSVLIRGLLYEFLRWGVVSTSPNPQAGPPPVGCPRLLIRQIRSYPPYWRPFLHPRNLRTRHAVVTGTLLSRRFSAIHSSKCREAALSTTHTRHCAVVHFRWSHLCTPRFLLHINKGIILPGMSKGIVATINAHHQKQGRFKPLYITDTILFLSLTQAQGKSGSVVMFLLT